MDTEKVRERIANICGYDNKRNCIKGDCTDSKICRTCEIMKQKNPEAYEHYRRLRLG